MATVTPQTPVQPIPGTDQAAENNPVVTSPTIALPTANKTEAKPGADPTKGTLKDKQTVNSQSPTRTNTSTDKTEYDPSGKISNTISTTDRSTTKRGVTTERTSSDSSTVGYDNSTSDVSIGRTTSEKKTTTRKNGKVETSESSESVQANIDREGDGAGFTYAKYDKAEKDKGKTGQTTSANIDLGDKTSDISHSVSKNGVTNQGGIKTDKDGVSEVSYGRSVEDNGVTKGGGVKINRDGVTVDASYGKKDGIQTGGSVTIGPNKTAVSVSLGKGDNKGSLSYTNIHGEVKQEAVTKDDGTVAGDLLKGDGYLSTTRRDEVAYGGSLGAKNVGLSGDVRSGSALQLFAALPENWEKLPKAEQEKASASGEDARRVGFLKRFTVFHVDQCDGLAMDPDAAPLPGRTEVLPHVEAVIAATKADIRIGGEMAFYSPSHDFIQVPPQEAYFEPVNWYRTKLHELGHWTGHVSRLDRNFSGRHGGEASGRATRAVVARP